MKRRMVVSLSLAALSCIIIISLFRGWYLYQIWLPIESLAVDISDPIHRTQTLSRLDAETVINASELALLSAPADSQGVAEMYQRSDDEYLLVVYNNGLFRRWNLNTLQAEEEFDFLAGSPRGVNFSADGLLVITPGAVVNATELNGYTVWDTQSGEVVECAGPHCPEGWSHINIVKAGVGLTPDAKWQIEYFSSLITISSLKLGMSASWDVDPDYYDISFHTISRIAFDSTGTYIACTTEEGRLLVYDFKNLFGLTGITDEEILAGRGYENQPHPWWVKRRQYGEYQPSANIITVDLAFDDTLTWLAQLTDQDLVVRDLGRAFFSSRMNLPIEGGTVLAFNHTGNLLAVGTQNGIALFDLKRLERIASFEVGEVTGLYFSRDDRLLLWGDLEGAIHLWGVAQNP